MEILRGIKNDFYIAVKDVVTQVDSIYRLKVYLNTERKQSKLSLKRDLQKLNLFHSGELLAFEMDPECTIDEDRYENENDTQVDDREDVIYIIDSRYNLFRFAITDSCEAKVIEQKSLKQFEYLQNQIDKRLRNRPFMKVGFCSKTISILDQTFSRSSDNFWDIQFDSRNQTSMKKYRQVLHIENSSFSNLQVSIVRQTNG